MKQILQNRGLKNHKTHLCFCGCGQNVKVHKYQKQGSNYVYYQVNSFIKSHENIGRIPWNKNKTFSEEVRHKMSLAHLGKEPVNKAVIDEKKLYQLYVLQKKNVNCVNKILGVSKDSIKNRLQALKLSRTTRESCNTPEFKEQMRLIRIKNLTSDKKIESPNNLEKLVYDTIDQFGVKYQKQVPILNKFVVDALRKNT